MTETGKTVGGAVLMAAVLGVAAGLALWQGGGDPDRRKAVMFVGRWSRGRPAATAVAASLGVTLVRSMPPLVALAWLTTSGGALRAAGAAGLVVAFYLLLLATDVLVTIISGLKP